MNLSKQEDMEKAIALLQEINYIALLRDAESGDGIVKHARASARGGRRAAARSNKAEMGAESVDGTTDPVHREPHDNENAGELEREADTTKDVTSSPPHAPKSLTRAISPPPTKVSSKPPPASSTASSSLAVPPLSISLHSLGVFPKPTAARVFFAHPHDPSNRLQTFGQLIRRHFREADLITETRPLVLHATVANLIYVRGKDRRAGKGKFAKGRPRAGDGTVDATELLRFFNGGEDNPRIHNQGGGHASPNLESIALGVSAGKSESQHEIHEVLASDPDSQALSSPQPQSTHSIPYVWATDIPVTSVRICKMGAQVSDTPGWGLEYSAVAEKVFMPDAMHEQEKTV
jgi:2'-5' RNA ligase